MIIKKNWEILKYIKTKKGLCYWTTEILGVAESKSTNHRRAKHDISPTDSMERGASKRLSLLISRVVSCKRVTHKLVSDKFFYEEIIFFCSFNKRKTYLFALLFVKDWLMFISVQRLPKWNESFWRWSTRP